ncbi:GNAT family N-acetyltransferase [Viridibacillus sp. YIM B01967]|uniref:GNAT family N-acetyltransferase n=1 Tax=Viridibacillus soli TaxID=2798301 RepID=A0ABS1H409_9BACL|nr:GNAT family N-acetyltransferase [Viridibacillus soli]MBK3494149.1 GNAT family N-acetyltransferase [Viridibacillus soli]
MGRSKELVMREIPQSEIAQSIELLNYVFQISLSINKDRLFVNAKSKQFDEGLALAWFDREQLVAQILNLPFQVNIHGTIYEMGGMTAVGTYPEYSRHGLMHDLMVESMMRMREEGRYIAYLFPYSIPYYRKKGFEIMSDILEYQVKDTQLPYYRDIPGQVRRIKDDFSDLRDVYNRYASNVHGAMVRNAIAWNEKFQESYWEEKFEGSDTKLQAAVYYDDDGLALGYMFYRIMEENFYIDELVYLKEVARKALWNFVHAHSSMVYNVFGKTSGNEAIAFLMEDSEIKQNVSPYFMARIIDVEKFLERFPFTKASFHIRLAITDSLLEWNHGTFEITAQAGEVMVAKICKEIEPGTVKMTVQTFVTMFLGYKRPTYLHSIERLKGGVASVSLLEGIIPNAVPSFIDYF